MGWGYMMKQGVLHFEFLRSISDSRCLVNRRIGLAEMEDCNVTRLPFQNN